MRDGKLPRESAVIQVHRIFTLTQMGRYDEALRAARAARRLLARGEPLYLAQLEANVGNVYYRLDRYKKALVHYDRARAIFQAEGEEALGAFRVITYNLHLESLRDVDTEMLSRYASKLYPTLFKRARHVVTENERVLEAVTALDAGDLEHVGRLMNESHNSLANDFEVSNPFIDRLVDLARENDTVLGAKLTGPGFGGCTVNLVRSDGIRAFTREVVRRYAEETSLPAEVYVVRPVAGMEIDRLAA